MRWHTVDYRAQRGGNRPGLLLDRGFWVYGVPRLILLCRLFGHRPVVDGTDPTPLANSRYRGPGNRWVCCDRCGIRPEPQGRLDPARWNIGEPYPGPYRTDWPTDPEERFRAIKAGAEPGPWPEHATGDLGGQLVLGKTFSTGLEVKVGNPGSEQVLAGHIGITPLGALYLHTEQHGTWLQRRLNPRSYESRVTGFSAHGGHLYWRLWARRDGWSRDDPTWQQGSFRINPVDIALGEKRYSYDNVGDPVTATLRMPHGDDHQLTLQLQRQTLTRKRRRRPLEQTWTVDIDTRPGIPTKPGGRGHILGFGVEITNAAREADWVHAALAEAAVRMTRDRARYDYTPSVTEPASSESTRADG
jgi:hypothetical protein